MQQIDGAGCQKTSEQDFSELLSRLELLPIEVSELILSHLRPADFVTVAASSPQLEDILQSTHLWRHSTVQISGKDVRSSLRQLELAPELKELAFGFGRLSPEAAKAISSYEGPTPYVRALRLSLSLLGTELGVALLRRHGPKARQLELDLRHAPLEPPRNNIALIFPLSDLRNLESLIIKTDVFSDVILLSQLALKMVEIDVHRLRVGEVLRGGPGPAVGAAAAHLISRHICHLTTLRLPVTFDANLSAIVMNCRELRVLACNVWTLPGIETLRHLHSLFVFPPDHYVTNEDIVILIEYARRSRSVLSKLKELHFVSGDVLCDVTSPLASPQIAQAIMCLSLGICKSLEVIEVEWEIGRGVNGRWMWLDTVLSNNSFHLRQLWLHGNEISPRYLLSLARYCPNLEILDVRRFIGTQGSDNTSKPKPVYVTTEGHAGMRRALTLLREALPKLTILFDDAWENIYDWNNYVDPQDVKFTTDQIYSRLRPYGTGVAEEKVGLDLFFLHLLSVDQWLSAEDFLVPARENVDLWQYATLDSKFWPFPHFTEMLSVVPALGLVDCRNGKALRYGKMGRQWLKTLARGPKKIRALRLRAVLVSSNYWGLVGPILQRLKNSLCCLELDFRGRPFRDWKGVLVTLGELPNLTEFVLRGVFDDQKPVLQWLHGRVRSLQRLDLRDCLMVDKHMPAFVESLQKLLLELRGTLRAVALPPLPLSMASSVLRILGELTDLREVAVHANELESLRPLTSLCAVELYGDRRPRSKISLERLARSFRNIGDTLRGVESLTLPVSLVGAQLVQEAILDVMPNLRQLVLTHQNRKVRSYAEGPQCKSLISKLV